MTPLEDANAALTPPARRFPLDMSQSVEEAEIRAMDAQRESDVQIRTLRPVWATRLLRVSVAWLVAVFCLVALQGFGGSVFHLSDPVIIAFITTTTLNALTSLAVVVKFIFPKKYGATQSGRSAGQPAKS
jgi:hypothetical protein